MGSGYVSTRTLLYYTCNYVNSFRSLQSSWTTRMLVALRNSINGIFFFLQDYILVYPDSVNRSGNYLAIATDINRYGNTAWGYGYVCTSPIIAIIVSFHINFCALSQNNDTVQIVIHVILLLPLLWIVKKIVLL